MSLRRFAQNNAASVTGSPRSPGTPRSSGSASASGSATGSGSASTPASPSPLGPGSPSDLTGAGLPQLPATPRARPRLSFATSPSALPSVSSSTPFDWDAARGLRPPPYGSPARALPRKGRKSEVGAGAGAKRFVRKRGIVERITSIPSRIAFEISIFPQNVPLPAPRTSAWLIGGSMHLLHLCVRLSQGRKVPEADMGWEDMYRENDSWFDWTVPMTFLLVAGAALNALFLFTRIKLYHLHSQTDLVSSPSASFVPLKLDRAPLEPPPLVARLRAGVWAVFMHFLRFLFNMSSPSSAASADVKTSRVQQLQVWAPGELELGLFGIYSPAHAFLWMATNGNNWILMCFVMVAVAGQLHIMTRSYEALLKDRAIIAAEVMHEYDHKFVYPRVNPIRRDVAVMTHQSEMVNWEDD